MNDPALEENEYYRVSEKKPPQGEEIILGETVQGIFNCFYTEIRKPYKRDGIDMPFYSKNNEYFGLRSDMYWRNL